MIETNLVLIPQEDISEIDTWKAHPVARFYRNYLGWWKLSAYKLSIVFIKSS